MSILTPAAPLRWFDAHNHLQDARFSGRQASLLAEARTAGVRAMVVNGSCEADWPDVQALAATNPDILPSYGYHPWHVQKRTPGWRENLVRFLEAGPCGIGEIGLDRWKPGLSYEGQEEVFTAQLTMAAERNLPVSIHCLRAWGRLFDLLRQHRRPTRGFLLHSYGGPFEMVTPLARLGAYFGFPGAYLRDRKARQRETFRAVPPDRLLVETDAPDQLLPETLNRHPLTRQAGPEAGIVLNHPANLGAVFEGLARFLGEPIESLGARVAENFRRLFVEAR